jgi:hypothetical protein
MSADIEQAILEKLKALPENKQREIFTLINEMLGEDQQLLPRRNLPANLGNH